MNCSGTSHFFLCPWTVAGPLRGFIRPTLKSNRAKTPQDLGHVVPVLGAFFSVIQMLYLPEGTWLRLVIWMGIGLIVYFFYSRRHSVLRQQMGNAKKKAIALSRQN